MKACALVVLAGCSWTGVAGSGTASREVRPAAAFQKIEIKGAIDAEVAIGAVPGVEISGDDNVIPLVTTEIRDDTLQIGTRKSFRPSVPLVVHITAPRITAVELSGSGHVALHDLRADELAVDLTGSGKVHGDGAVRQLRVALSGSGGLELEQLAAERTSVTISGSGNASVAASRALDIHISGSGNVTYRGEPADLKQDISGSGRVVRR